MHNINIPSWDLDSEYDTQTQFNKATAESTGESGVPNSGLHKGDQDEAPNNAQHPRGTANPNAWLHTYHSYCPDLAKDHGVEAALIFQSLGYKIAKKPKDKDGERWFYETLDELAVRMPYLTRSGIDGILKREAAKGNIHKKRRGKKWKNLTYTMPEEFLNRALKKKGRIKFNVAVAIDCESIIPEWMEWSPNIESTSHVHINIRFQHLRRSRRKIPGSSGTG